MNLIDALDDVRLPCLAARLPWRDVVKFYNCGLEVTGELARMDMQPPIVQEVRLAHVKHHFRCKHKGPITLNVTEHHSGIFTTYTAKCEHL